MWDFEINTGNCLTEMAEDNLCSAGLFPKQLWKFAVSSGMSKVLMLEVFELSCQAHKSFLTQMATAVSSLPERG